MDELNTPSNFMLLIITAMLAILILRFVVPAVLIALYYVLLAAVELLIFVPFKWLLRKLLRRNRWPKPQPRPGTYGGYSVHKIGKPITVKRPVSFRVYREANAKYNQPEPDALWDGELKQC